MIMGMIPVNDCSDGRYDDPFIRIVELYALSAIGALDREDRLRMEEITPDLRKIFGLEVGWKKIVERVMEFGPDAEEEVRRLWSEWKEKGTKGGTERFAREFADRCFPADDDEG
jgi:hypothetical protein